MRCPACGWSNALKNYPKMIARLQQNLDDITLERLNDLFISALDDLTAYTLLKACQDIDDEVIKHCITISISSETKITYNNIITICYKYIL